MSVVSYSLGLWALFNALFAACFICPPYRNG
jgi:hypothetical protein